MKLVLRAYISAASGAPSLRSPHRDPNLSLASGAWRLFCGREPHSPRAATPFPATPWPASTTRRSRASTSTAGSASPPPATPSTAAGKANYDPPTYAKCVANKKQDGAEARQGPAGDDRRAVQDAVQAGVRGPARPGAAVPDPREVGHAARPPTRASRSPPRRTTAAFEKAKKDTFPKEADFQKFLKQSGMTVADAKFQVAFNTIYVKLREKAIKGADKVTDKAVADVLRQEQEALRPARDARPARRADEDQGEGRRRAQGARGAATRGGNVAKKYSIDQASKGNGGSLLGVAKGSQEKAFDDALFAADKGKLTGPVKVQFGYYVFQVQKITPAKQQTLKEAHAGDQAGARRRRTRRRPTTSSTRTSATSGRTRRTAATATSWISARTRRSRRRRRPRPAGQVQQAPPPRAGAAAPQQRRRSSPAGAGAGRLGFAPR